MRVPTRKRLAHHCRPLEASSADTFNSFTPPHYHMQPHGKAALLSSFITVLKKVLEWRAGPWMEIKN